MRTSAIASIVLATLSSTSANPLLQGRAACNADNCARIVTGTRDGLPATRLADCSSFQQVYVIPTPVTSTITQYTQTTVVLNEPVTEFDYVSKTITSTVPGTVIVERPTSSPIVTAIPAKRAADIATGNAATKPITSSQTSVPTYAASACSPASRYASACSCAGVTRTTSTLKPVTSFVTTTSDLGTYTITTYTTVATDTVTNTVVDYDTVPTVTATGLPCGQRINPHVGYEDSYLVRCNSGADRNIYLLQSGYATTEYECLLNCARNGLCDWATYQFNTLVCRLFRGDGANPGIYPFQGQDLIQRIMRGTGTGSGYASPTGTIAARRLDKPLHRRG